MKEINILDCTLRDGGYVNNWKFNEKDTLKTITKLLDANVEIVECGFLDAKNGSDEDCTRFKSFEKLESLVEDVHLQEKQMLVAMVEYGKYDVQSLPIVTKNTKVKGIRFSFRKSDFQVALKEMPKIIEKGYELFVQPISTLCYSENELENLLKEVNALDPYAVYIVDTQGAMFVDDFELLYKKMDTFLNPSVKIGFHSHNNMQLSYSIAIGFIELDKQRGIIIDASIYGMGRGAGNLNTELLADYINKKVVSKYVIEEILELIDSYYYAIYKEKEWGYSLAHFLSASLECHPNYASYLLDTKHLTINEIKYILSQISSAESYEYNKVYIENLYFAYNEIKQDNINAPIFPKEKKVLLIGSGKNLEEKLGEIVLKKEEYLFIALNHIPKNIVPDYYFFSSQKRLNEFYHQVDLEKVIVTNNIRSNAKYKVDYKKLSNVEELHNDNSAVMMINFLLQSSLTEVYVAGVDGFSVTRNNYNYDEKDAIVDEDAIHNLNKSIQQALQVLSKSIRINFLTRSLFEVKSKPRVVGVIPSRYASTRLPQKPLVDIEGLPMVVHVMKRAQLCKDLDEVIVATDDQRIFDTVKKFGGNAIMTSQDHQNGTLRMHEVSTKVQGDLFVLLNGDEPLIEPKFIKESIDGLLSSTKAVASLLVTPYSERNNQSNFKVALNKFDEVMYISRNDIPSDARSDLKPMWKAFHIVSYRKDFLDLYANELEQTELDAREMDDQLRILEYGYTIQAVKTHSDAISVDTQADLERVRELIKSDKLLPLYRDC